MKLAFSQFSFYNSLTKAQRLGNAIGGFIELLTWNCLLFFNHIEEVGTDFNGIKHALRFVLGLSKLLHYWSLLTVQNSMDLTEKRHVVCKSASISVLKFKVEFAFSILSEQGSWLSEGMAE